MKLFKILALILLFAGCASVHPVQQSKVIAVRCGRLLDVRSGAAISNALILIEGEKITAVGQNLSIPQGARIIDLSSLTVLPGLVDAHTHITYHFDESGRFGLTADPRDSVTALYAAQNARATLLAGFTTIRNLGAGGLVDIDLRDSIARGEVAGPRMIVSGVPLLPDAVRQSADKDARLNAMREFVRARLREGVDVVKIFEGLDQRGRPAFSEEEIRAAVDEAAKAGRRVAVHAHEAEAVKAAVRGGCSSIEHGSFLDDEAMRLLVEHHTPLVPTLYLPTHYLEHKSQFAFGNQTWSFFEQLRSRNLENVRRARRAGVQVVSGSDAVAGLHGQNARELEWLVKAGLTPLEAIRAATIDAASLLNMEDSIGEIRAGKFADIIAVTGDPSGDIKALQQVEFVMKSGQVIKDISVKTPAR